MAKLPRQAAGSSRGSSYKTGETDLIGLLVARATGKHLAEDLSETVWSRAGMAGDAVWATDAKGDEMGGRRLSMTLEDDGRFGLFFLHGGDSGRRPSVAAWLGLREATAAAIRSDTADFGYGFQRLVSPRTAATKRSACSVKRYTSTPRTICLRWS